MEKRERLSKKIVNVPRIAGVDLLRDERIELGLIYIHGIGRSTSNEILGEIEVDLGTRVRDLNETEAAALIRTCGVGVPEMASTLYYQEEDIIASHAN